MLENGQLKKIIKQPTKTWKHQRLRETPISKRNKNKLEKDESNSFDR